MASRTPTVRLAIAILEDVAQAQLNVAAWPSLLVMRPNVALVGLASAPFQFGDSELKISARNWRLCVARRFTFLKNAMSH